MVHDQQVLVVGASQHAGRMLDPVGIRASTVLIPCQSSILRVCNR